MAIELASKPNTVTTDADYLLGRFRNFVPGTPGTPVTLDTMGDYIQFFLKLVDASGITLNDLPDNSTNGYQLFEALEAVINPSFITTGITYASGWANVGGANFATAYKVDGNEVSLSGNAQKDSPGTGNVDMLTLPLAARPAFTVYVPTMAVVNSTVTMVIIRITTAGVISTNISSNVYHEVHFEGVRYRIS